MTNRLTNLTGLSHEKKDSLIARLVRGTVLSSFFAVPFFAVDGLLRTLSRCWQAGALSYLAAVSNALKVFWKPPPVTEPAMMMASAVANADASHSPPRTSQSSINRPIFRCT